jgi:hypothetical protein
MASASDTFDGSENPLATDWNNGMGLSGISEGSGVASSLGNNGDFGSFWDPAVTTFSANHYSEVVIGTMANDGGPAVRCSATVGYSIDCNTGGAGQILRWSTGSASNVGTAVTFDSAIVAGDTVRLSVTTVGGDVVFTATRNGNATTPATVTDVAANNPILTGQPGMHIFGSSLTYASWAAADIGPAPDQPWRRLVQLATIADWWPKAGEYAR